MFDEPPMTNRPTIRDVAARAGVSKSTVSLVLKDSPLVRPDKRAAIRRAMEELGYVYNSVAAGLRWRAVQLAPGIPTAAPPQMAAQSVTLCTDLTDAHCAAFAAALLNAAAARGIGLYLPPPQGAGQAAGAPGARRISTLPRDPASDTTLTALHYKAQLRPHWMLGAGKAVRHLLGLGAKRVAFVGGDKASDHDALRLNGYMKRMSRSGVSPLTVLGGDDAAFGAAALGQILAEDPHCTAALCNSDQVALGMSQALVARGMVPGQDFYLIGWGNTAVAAAHDLSSVGLPWAEMANIALAWALQTPDAPVAAPGEEVAPNLIHRASGKGGAA
jgi:LacI family transcriptional regulator